MHAECLPKAEACGGPEQLDCGPGRVCEYGPYVGDNDGWGTGTTPAENEAKGGYGRCVSSLDAAIDAPGDASVGD